MIKATSLGARKQRGIATILIILVVGLSMMALAMSTVHNVKSTQQKHIAVHATAHAQPLVWTAVEVFRSYLETLTEDQLKALAPSNNKIPINVSSIDAATASLTAKLLTAPSLIKEGDFEYYKVSTIISALHHSASASASLNAVYYVAPPGGKSCIECTILGATLDFHDDLVIEGNITVTPRTGTPVIFNVDGGVSAVKVSLTSINYLNTTGDIALNSQTFIDELYSNGSIDIAGSAGTLKASALGNVTLDAAVQADIIRTNSDVILKSVSRAKTSIDALGSIYNQSNADQGLATAGQNILSSGTSGSMKQAFAVGDIDIGSANTAIPHLKAQGNIACPGVGWRKFTSIRAQGSVTNCPANPPNENGNSSTTLDIQENTAVSIPLMEALEPFVMPKPMINVWELKEYANYIFTREGSYTRVLVKNINGIEDGNYYLADYPQKPERYYRDFLCKELDDKGFCASPAAPSDTKTICYGFSQNNDCLNYDNKTGTWVFGGKSAAPGVMWFEGNLELGDGIYYNTFLVSGDVTTSGGLETSAPNFAGFDGTCLLDYPKNKNPTGDFDSLYPTSLCNLPTPTMKYNPIGNIAIAAGGTVPGEASYSGGNISLGSSNVVNGTILAGEHLFTHGSSIVRGYVTATSQSGKGYSGKHNSIGGSTSILLNDLPNDYYPPIIPPMAPEDPNEKDNGGKGFSKIVWARYL